MSKTVQFDYQNLPLSSENLIQWSRSQHIGITKYPQHVERIGNIKATTQCTRLVKNESAQVSQDSNFTRAHRLESMLSVTVTSEDLSLRLNEHRDAAVSMCTKEPVAVIHPDPPLVELLSTPCSYWLNLPVVDKKFGRLAGIISHYDGGLKSLEGGFWK